MSLHSGTRTGPQAMQARRFVFLPLVLIFLALVGTPRAAIPPDADDADFVPVDLGTLGGRISSAVGVNDRGQVVGNSYIDAGNVAQHAFSWTATDGMVDLGTLGGSISSAAAVNARGQVVGYSYIDAGNVAQHAFSWTATDGMLDLGTLGGFFSQATAVNARGHVVGVSSTADVVADHAFLWTARDGMVDLGTLGSLSVATAVECPRPSRGLQRYQPREFRAACVFVDRERWDG
jgi:probable HAF family extracellular repeat protein